jgi:DNA-binding PadR family transcriptional regulator
VERADPEPAREANVGKRDFKTDPAELVVLAVLEDGAQYGYAITKEVAARSEGELKLGPSALYPLLARLEKESLVSADWEEIKSDRAEAEAPGRRRKWYRLTAKGRKRLEKRITAHRAYVALMEAFIGRSAREESP